MKKVLIVIPGSNKGGFISNGFAEAFKQLSFFVFKRPLHNLNIDEVLEAAPDIIFIYQTSQEDSALIYDYALKCSPGTIFIHCSEFLNNISEKFFNLKNHYIFSADSRNKKQTYVHSVSASDYKTDFKGYKYKITFAGNPAEKDRETVLAALVKNFGRINIFCRSFDFYKSLEDIQKKKLLSDEETELYKKSYKGYVNKQQELAEIYISSKINIDINSADNISYRLLEITASGGFALASYSDKIIKQYNGGRDAETYKNTAELIDKAEFYLKHTDIADSIAARGRKNTLSSFSYCSRLDEMLRVIYGKNFNCR